jgi:4-hydroxybutyrate CoA-transferase
MSQLASLFAPGARVFVCGAVGEPTGLVETLSREALPDNLHFVQFPLPGYNTTDFTAWGPTVEMTTFFMTPALKDASPERRHFLPMQMRAVFDYLQRDIDVALIQVARDRDGVLRAGPNVDFLEAALVSAGTVIAELNDRIVAPAGAPRIVESRIDHTVRTERDLYEMPRPKIDAAAAEIGRLTAGLIADGDCIQTGIGAIPAAILGELAHKNDLGLHGGLLDDGGRALIERGVVTGAAKAIDTAQHVTGMALGSAALVRWTADRPDVVFRGADYTHEMAVIRQLDNFVSINSALEVDLYGQANAEMAAHRQISGTGGSVDFMRAAKSSKGGHSIIAMNATARGGTVSRIVPKVELATALRTDVDIVVTEYGVARVKDLPVAARARALIDIAAPQFRDKLAAQLPG